MFFPSVLLCWINGSVSSSRADVGVSHYSGCVTFSRGTQISNLISRGLSHNLNGQKILIGFCFESEKLLSNRFVENFQVRVPLDIPLPESPPHFYLRGPHQKYPWRGLNAVFLCPRDDRNVWIMDAHLIWPFDSFHSWPAYWESFLALSR